MMWPVPMRVSRPLVCFPPARSRVSPERDLPDHGYGQGWLSCVSCGTKAQPRDLAITLFLGWWGCLGMLKKPDPRKPTVALRGVVSSNRAAQVIALRK
jgi:hypothetical protein